MAKAFMPSEDGTWIIGKYLGTAVGKGGKLEAHLESDNPEYPIRIALDAKFNPQTGAPIETVGLRPGEQRVAFLVTQEPVKLASGFGFMINRCQAIEVVEDLVAAGPRSAPSAA